ncbi:MAG: hypothetical protein H0X29_08525 [Parachlamydiaceae bacterium]|nr:hypothetical protein [Parachlamydiaceae bacterium]
MSTGNIGNTSVSYSMKSISNSMELFSKNNNEIVNLKKDLSSYEKNPNFYRNRKIVGIAKSIAVVAAVALACYFTFSIGVPLFIAALSGFSPSGLAAGGILFTMSAPAGGLSVIPKLNPFIYRSAQGDKARVEKLADENKALKASAITKKTTLSHYLEILKENVKSCEIVLEYKFNEDIWSHVTKLLPHLANIKDVEQQEFEWRKYNTFFLGQKQNLPTQINSLESQLIDLEVEIDLMER